ncbi:transglutaminase domain-containing protein [Ktedonobacteria bacterium brp13]|nr:transglutaminase domain-containing protein [Ktedonobacteria bacterium brp13]
MKDEILTFYREQSAITRPGKQSALFTDLPQSIEALCKIVQGLIIHYRCGDLYGCQITAESEREIDTRYIERMLERVIELDPRSLSEARAPQQRLVGCCRDFSTMLCSMLRYQGIPARIRMGFAGYIDLGPGFYTDHVVVEYWHEGEGRWRMVDPQMDAFLIKTNGIDFDVQDIPQGRFLTGGEAWRRCRAGEADPDNFGIHPEVKEIRGWWLVRDKVVQDLAALNRVEMLCWDAWGMMLGKEISDEEAHLLDTIADLTLNSDAAFEELRRCSAQEERVRLNGHVRDSSPAVGPHEVMLTL